MSELKKQFDERNKNLRLWPTWKLKLNTVGVDTLLHCDAITLASQPKVTSMQEQLQSEQPAPAPVYPAAVGATGWVTPIQAEPAPTPAVIEPWTNYCECVLTPMLASLENRIMEQHNTLCTIIGMLERQREEPR